jgi:hypothetical protein
MGMVRAELTDAAVTVTRTPDSFIVDTLIIDIENTGQRYVWKNTHMQKDKTTGDAAAAAAAGSVAAVGSTPAASLTREALTATDLQWWRANRYFRDDYVEAIVGLPAWAQIGAGVLVSAVLLGIGRVAYRVRAHRPFLKHSRMLIRDPRAVAYFGENIKYARTNPLFNGFSKDTTLNFEFEITSDVYPTGGKLRMSGVKSQTGAEGGDAMQWRVKNTLQLKGKAPKTFTVEYEDV